MKRAQIMRYVGGMIVAALVTTGCNTSTPEPQLLPTRTLAPRVTAVVTTEAPAQDTQPAAVSTPAPLTGLTLENIDQLKPVFTIDEPPPQHIYSVSDDRLTLYNSRSFEVIDPATLEVKTRTPVQLSNTGDGGFWYAASPNGKFGAIMQLDGIVDIYDLDTSKVATTVSVPKPAFDGASDIALNEDGSELVVISQGELRRVNLADGKVVGEGQTLPPATQAIRFSENASRVAAIQATGEIVIMNALSGRAPITLTSVFTGTAVQNFNFSPDGSKFGASDGSSLVIWNVDEDGANVQQTFTGLGSAVDPVFDRSGRYMAAMAGPSAFLYDLQEKAGKDEFRLTGSAPVRSANFDPKGETLFVAGSGELASFSVADGKSLQSSTRPPVTRAVFSGDGKTVATWSTVYQSTDVALIDADTGEVRSRLIHDAPVAWVTLSTGGAAGAASKYVSTLAFDRSMRVWRLSDGESLVNITAPTTNTIRTMLCFTPDENGFVYLDGQRVIAHSVEDDRRADSFDLPFEPKFISGCANNKGYLAAASGTGISVFDLSGKTIATIGDSGDLDQAGALYMSKDGNRVAALSQTRLTIWDVATQQEVQTVRLQRDPLFGTFSPRSDKFALNFGDDVDVLDIASGELVSLDLPKGSSVTAFFPQDSRLIITAAMIPTRETAEKPFNQRVFASGELGVWDLQQSGQLARKIETDEAIYAADISDDGSHIATNTRDNAMTVWSVEK